MLSCSGASAWPQLSDDPLEQFLLEEALVLLAEAEDREVADREAEERRLQVARDEAQREARARLEEAKLRGIR